MFLVVTIDSGIEVAINVDSIIDMSPSITGDHTYITLVDETYCCKHDFVEILNRLEYTNKNQLLVIRPNVNQEK